MSKWELNVDRVRDIIERRVLSAPQDVRAKFPEVIRNEVRWIAYGDNAIFALVFLTSEGLQLAQGYSKQQLAPFPALFTSDPTQSCAFRIENAPRAFLSGNYVAHTFSFGVGRNSRLIVEDHRQFIETKEIGSVDYTVPLAYLIGFGDRLPVDTAYESMEEMIVFSIGQWRMRP